MDMCTFAEVHVVIPNPTRQVRRADGGVWGWTLLILSSTRTTELCDSHQREGRSAQLNIHHASPSLQRSSIYITSPLTTSSITTMKPTNPVKGSFQFVSARAVMLEYRATQTKSAMSRLRANYHLFLRNQPKKPETFIKRYNYRLKPWKAPIVKY